MKNIRISYSILLFILNINHIHVMASASYVQVTSYLDNKNVTGFYQLDDRPTSGVSEKTPDIHQYTKTPFSQYYTKNAGSFSLTTFVHTKKGKFCGGVTVERRTDDLSKIYYKYTPPIKKYKECKNAYFILYLKGNMDGENYKIKPLPIKKAKEKIIKTGQSSHISFYLSVTDTLSSS